MLHQDDIKLLSSLLPFWDKLEAPQRALLLANTASVHYEKGQSLHCGQSDCLGVLVLKSGSLRIYITSEEGREVTLYRLSAGDICVLSASCVLHSIAFDVSVDAETECSVLQICPSAFSRLTAANVYVELFSYRLATERFSEIMWVMQQVLFISVDKRLAAFLLEESRKAGSLTIHMTHEQIARHLGTAREVISRMLKYFSSEGYLTLSRGGITITDPELLRPLCHPCRSQVR